MAAEANEATISKYLALSYGCALSNQPPQAPTELELHPSPSLPYFAVAAPVHSPTHKVAEHTRPHVCPAA